MTSAVLALDQGTTNSKAVLIGRSGAVVSRGSAPVAVSHPRPAWVEQDARAIWSSVLAAVAECLAGAPGVSIEAIGVSNQRESVLAWDGRTGEPLGPVVSWQCRRTADDCARLVAEGVGPEVLALTGLPLDPMFPATKLRWLAENCRRAGDVRLGTVDSWIVWNLTGGAVHATDASNAARTQLLDIASLAWDGRLLDIFAVDRAGLPEVRDSAGAFGVTAGAPGLADGLPVAAAIGDSHAALFAHGASEPGDGKATFGTGSSVMTTLAAFAPPPPGLTTTVAWALGGRATYAFEGNILVSASLFPWAARLLGLADVDALLALAETASDSAGVAMVPAHVGLGAPHWSTGARGLVSGLTFGAGPAHVARAAAESMALQVLDVLDAMGAANGALFVDGGPTRSPFLRRLVADVLGRPIAVRDAPEASALGAGYLAGLAVGFWPDRAALRAIAPPAAIVEPSADPAARDALVAGWRRAVTRALAP